MKKYLSSVVGICCLLLVFAGLFTGCGENYYQELAEQLFSETANDSGKVTEEKEKEQRETPVRKKEVTREENTSEETEWEEIQPEEADSVYVKNYAYSTLDDSTKKVYDEVLDAVLEHKEKIEVSTLDIDVLEKAYNAVCADHGGLFWVSGYMYTQYTLGDTLVSMDFSPKYTMDVQEREKIQQQIDAVAEEFLTGISMADTDYDKAKYIFETLIKNVDYDVSAENNQNIISVFLNRATVCQGYACATQYLLEKIGIHSTIVKGFANGESHAWNLIRLNGKYYYMDTTWGNSRYRDNSSAVEKYVNYSYMAVSSEEISRTHILDTSFPLPECTSMSHNYFVREGLYFTAWEPENIGQLLAKAWDAGEEEIALKFSSPALYEQTLEYFITEQHIADYCENISSVYYLTDEEQYVTIFRF